METSGTRGTHDRRVGAIAALLSRESEVSRFPLCLALAMGFSLLTNPVGAQSSRETEGSGLDLTVGGYGLAIGNIPRVNGLRINFKDRYLERVNGVNLTLWNPEEGVGGEIDGLALGVVATGADRIHGLNLGLLASVTGQHMAGVNLGGLALVSEGDIAGISVGGLATVTSRRTYGLSVAGLAVVSEAEISGIAVGGLATVSQGTLRGLGVGGLATVAEGGIDGVAVGTLATVSQRSVRGIALGGLATVSEGGLDGIGVGGLATVAQDHVRGLSFGGLAVVSEGDVSGLSLGGLAVVAGNGSVRGLAAGLAAVVAEDGLHGVAAAGYKVQAYDTRGITLALGWLETADMTGLSVASYNRVRGLQTGLSIGLYNSADELHGLQFGLLNRAGNNRPGLRYLPFVNAHFD